MPNSELFSGARKFISASMPDIRRLEEEKGKELKKMICQLADTIKDEAPFIDIELNANPTDMPLRIHKYSPFSLDNPLKRTCLRIKSIIDPNPLSLIEKTVAERIGNTETTDRDWGIPISTIREIRLPEDKQPAIILREVATWELLENEFGLTVIDRLEEIAIAKEKWPAEASQQNSK